MSKATLPSFLIYSHKQLMVLRKSLLNWKIVLVSSKIVFIEKEAAWLCITMQRHVRTMIGLMWCMKILYRYHSV